MQTPTAQRVFVTGAAGFVGSAIVEELLSRGHEVTALVHRGELRSGAGRVKIVRGDVFSQEALSQGMAGQTAIIHLVGIIAEQPSRGVTFERIHYQGAKNVMNAAVQAGVHRYVHMSSFGSRPDAVSDYHKTKFKAEKALGKSGLDWTIFRPSLIHGPGGEFLTMEADWRRGRRAPFLFMPYFGGGLLGWRPPAHILPVYVKDVARAFVDALGNPATVGQIYNLCGSQRITWPQMHHIAARIIKGKKKATLAVPAWYGKLLTYLAPAALLPFTRDQITMALEDANCDMEKFAKDFGWKPEGFEHALQSYVSLIK